MDLAKAKDYYRTDLHTGVEVIRVPDQAVCVG